MEYGIGYDIGLAANLMLGLQISYTMGNLSEFELDYGTSPDRIELGDEEHKGMNRLDFSIGLRFVKKSRE